MFDEWDHWLVWGGEMPGLDLPIVYYPIGFEPNKFTEISNE